MIFGQKICKECCQLHVPFTGEAWQKVVRDIIWILGLLCTYIIIFSYFFLLYLILFLIFALRIKMRPLSAKLKISSFLYTAIRFHIFYYSFHQRICNNENVKDSDDQLTRVSRGWLGLWKFHFGKCNLFPWRGNLDNQWCQVECQQGELTGGCSPQ